MNVVVVFPETNVYTQAGVYQLPPSPAAVGEILRDFKVYMDTFQSVSLEKIENHTSGQHAPGAHVLYGEAGWQGGTIVHDTHKVTSVEYA